MGDNDPPHPLRATVQIPPRGPSKTAQGLASIAPTLEPADDALRERDLKGALLCLREAANSVRSDKALRDRWVNIAASAWPRAIRAALPPALELARLGQLRERTDLLTPPVDPEGLWTAAGEALYAIASANEGAFESFAEALPSTEVAATVNLTALPLWRLGLDVIDDVVTEFTRGVDRTRAVEIGSATSTTQRRRIFDDCIASYSKLDEFLRAGGGRGRVPNAISPQMVAVAARLAAVASESAAILDKAPDARVKDLEARRNLLRAHLGASALSDSKLKTAGIEDDAMLVALAKSLFETQWLDETLALAKEVSASSASREGAARDMGLAVIFATRIFGAASASHAVDSRWPTLNTFIQAPGGLRSSSAWRRLLSLVS